MDSPKLLFRSATIDPNTVDTETRTVDISFSSEFAVKRADGYEVLSHQDGDADFTRISAGSAPLLLDHDHTTQIGVVRSAGIVDGRGQATIQFSRSVQGQEIYQDVLDGIRTNISVGYFTYDRKLDGKRDGTNVYRYKWQPYEISLVSLPADSTVGVGRTDQETQTQSENERTQTMDANLEIAEIEAVEATRDAEILTKTTRAAKPEDVQTICARYGFEAEATELVRGEKTLQEVKDHIIDLWSTRAKETVIVPTRAPAVHTRTQAPYSLGKALRAATTGDWNSDAGLERETCQELAKNCQRAWDTNVAMIDMTRATALTPAVSAGAVGFGKELVGSTYMPERLVDALWNKTYLNKVGTDSMLGLVGNASFPVITNNLVATMVGEVADIGAPQALATALKTISPKEMIVKAAYSRQALLQNQPNIEGKITDQIFNAIAQKLDGLAMTNTGVTLSTTGLVNEITQIVSLGTTGGVPTLAMFTNLRKLLIASKVDPDTAKLLVSTALFETLGVTPKTSADTASNMLLNEGQKSIKGNELIWSQNVPSNLTKGSGTNLSAAILGNFDDLLVAQWGNIALEVDRISAADTSQIVIRAYSFWDMVIKRLESFAIVKDVIA